MSKEKGIEQAEGMESRYQKAQLLRAKQFANHRDLLSALLTEDCLYTIKEVESKVESFRKRKVN